MESAFIEIDSQQFINNLQVVVKHINYKNTTNKPIKLCLPIKANAYGHGLSGIASLAQHSVDYLAVSSLHEGIMARLAAPHTPILVFGSLNQEQISELIEHDLDITVASLFKAKLLLDYCQSHHKSAKVHIKIDTGMNRIGVKETSFYELFEYLRQFSCIKITGIYSHLASSENTNDQLSLTQINAFGRIVKYVKSIDPEIICHLANSGGVINYPTSYFDMVRPGLLCYGYLSTQMPHNSLGLLANINSVFSLKSYIVYFKVATYGEGISYNHTYIVTKDYTRIITVPVGYGDGYRRSLSNIGRVIINNNYYPIAGNICMDMFMVDIGHDEAYINDEVVLIGTSSDKCISIVEIAKLYNSIIYEVLTGFNERIPRLYK